MVESERTCSIEGCDARVVGWGWCIKHYRRWQAHGNPLTIVNIIGDDAARFATKIEVQPNGCHRWISPPDKDGYGRFGAGGKTYRAHIYAWVQEHGPLPDGLQLDHVCHNTDPDCPGGRACLHRLCVNIDHLALGTTRDNLRASRHTIASKNAAKTHCKRGHEFTPENTMRVKDGRYRACRTCYRNQSREWHRRRRARPA